MSKSIFEMTDAELEAEKMRAQRNIGKLVALAFAALGVYLIAIAIAL